MIRQIFSWHLKCSTGQNRMLSLSFYLNCQFSHEMGKNNSCDSENKICLPLEQPKCICLSLYTIRNFLFGSLNNIFCLACRYYCDTVGVLAVEVAWHHSTMAGKWRLRCTFNKNWGLLTRRGRAMSPGPPILSSFSWARSLKTFCQLLTM